MKLTLLLVMIFISNLSFSQESEWIKTDAEITEINIHRGRKTRETAIVKFNLENGKQQFASTELLHIPLVGSMKSVGDIISVNYKTSNPAIVETNTGKFLTDYGMYILYALGILGSLNFYIREKRKLKKSTTNNANS